jgi:hypothetical protein
MEIARREFQIPLVLEPEYLASPFLDELSGMTYLSYFMKEDSPGFHATLRWVNNQIPDTHVRNFTVSKLSFVMKSTILDILNIFGSGFLQFDHDFGDFNQHNQHSTLFLTDAKLFFCKYEEYKT